MSITGVRAGLKKLVNTLFSEQYSLITNTVTGCILFVLGDAVEQKLEINSQLQTKYDVDRLKRIGIIGLLEGPPHYVFYKYMDVFLPGKSASTVTKKIFVDQVIACPFFNFQFFVGMAWLEGKPLPQCWDEFVRKFPTVYLVDCILWPPCQILNFWLVPPKYRVLYINVATVFWNVFLSYMKHYDQYNILPEMNSSAEDTHPGNLKNEKGIRRAE